MKRKSILLVTVLLFMAVFTASAADNIVGFWKTVDDVTGLPKSVLAIYEYKGKIYGRIIATYNSEGQPLATIANPQFKAEGWDNEDEAPYYCGLDIIWNLKDKGKKWKGGTILDPEAGKQYASEIWLENGVMKVRGELRVFGVSTGIGRSQDWYSMNKSELPADIKDYSLSGIKPDIRTP